MKNDKRLLVSLALNIIVFLLVIAGTIVMITVKSEELATNNISVFKYFTFQSNIFMGCVAIVYAYYQLLIIKKKRDKIPHVLTIFHLVATGAVALTFVVVIAFLGPGYGYDKMYKNANFFFHLVVPVFAIVNFIFFTKSEKYHFIQTLFSIFPSFLYGIVYFIVVASQNAYGDINIDFYFFGKDGPIVGAFNFLAVMIISYVIAVLLYFTNRLIFKKSNK